MIQIQLNLPESAFSALRSTPDEFGRELLIAAVVKWYEVGMVSQSKVAEIADIRVLQLNTYPGSHRDRPSGQSSRPWHGCFFSWDTLSRQGFLAALNRFEVSPFQTTPEELEKAL